MAPPAMRRDNAAMSSHMLLILGLLFPLISWLTLASGNRKGLEGKMKFHRYFVWLLLLFPVHAFATRERQSLEAFDRELLVVKAIYFNKSRGYSYALVRDPGGYIHRAYRGDYLGKDFGRIVEISRQKGVRALEAIQDADGEWVQREVWIPFEKR